MTAARFALAALLLVTTACGGGSLDDDIAGLRSSLDGGKLEDVVTAAPAVLDRCASEAAPDHKTWQVEKMRLQALARQGHGKQTVEHLERLAGTYDKVDGKLYAALGDEVTSAQNLIEAIDVLDAGVKRFPDLKDFFEPQIAKLKAQAEASGDAGALAKLKSLGYL